MKKQACFQLCFNWKCFQSLMYGLRVSPYQSPLMITLHYIFFHQTQGNYFFKFTIDQVVLSKFGLLSSCFSCFRCEKEFDQLVEQMIGEELALRATVTNAELLVFTSTELPLLYWSELLFDPLFHCLHILPILVFPEDDMLAKQETMFSCFSLLCILYC